MSAEPAAQTLEALLKKLQDLKPGSSPQEVLALLREPQSDALEHAKRQAALVRVLDLDVYAFLLGASGDTPPSPTFDELLDAFPNDFPPIGSASWEMRAAERALLLANWQKDPNAWRAWNSTLYADYFKPRGDKASQLEAVYHAAASTYPAEAVPFFEACYKDADDRADFAQCHALLEAVRTQADFRFEEFSAAYRDRTRYLQSRLLFLDPLRKSGSYLDRTDPREQFDLVLTRQEPAWIFHLHATGGLGKSMFVRYTVSRDLVRRRIPCAYVDFDDHKLVTFVQHPFKLLAILLRQWARQLTSTTLSSVVELVSAAQDREGWDPVLLSDVQIKLEGAGLQGEMLVVLDTLEEATLSQPMWLIACVDMLRRLRAHVPGLSVILSGRYDLTRIAGLFQPDEVVPCELLPFSREEAEAYLTLRQVTDTDMREAILARASMDATELRLNPFKLSLLVELVQDRHGLTPEDVRTLPNVDIAYLIERVILRIPSQPLRWMIRYGAIARRLTIPFLEEVLLPPLQAALRGTATDLAGAHLTDDVRRYLDSKVTWEPDPALAETLKSSVLWADLAAYARERGWISMLSDGDALQLHPEVVKPIQILLSPEAIYVTLHEKARDFYLNRWSSRATPNTKNDTTAATEAIYHSAALRADARKLWLTLLKEAVGESVYPIATEPTRAAYMNEDGAPLNKAWCCEAHVESARTVLHDPARIAIDADDGLASFRVHVAAATQQDPASVPQLFAILAHSDDLALTPSQKALRIERALSSFTEPYDLFWLRVQAARYWMSAHQHDDRAEKHWIDAAKLVARAGLSATHWEPIQLVLATLARRQGRYKEAMAIYDGMRQATSVVGDIAVQQATLALEHHDLKRAAPLVSQLNALPPSSSSIDPAALRELELRTMVEVGDLKPFFERLPDARNLALNDAERSARLALLEGEARARLMDFPAALEAFSAATDISRSGAAGLRAQTRDAEVLAFDMKNPSRALQNLQSAGPLEFAFVRNERARISEDAVRRETVTALVELLGGQKERARKWIDRLIDGETPAGRARGLLIGLAHGLFADAEKRIRALIDALRALDPPQLCVDIALILPQLPVSPALKPAYNEMIGFLGKLVSTPDETPVDLPLQLLDLARICGVDRNEARARLRVAEALHPQARTAWLWYGHRLLEHYAYFDVDPPLGYEDLLSQTSALGAANTPLEALLKSKVEAQLWRVNEARQVRSVESIAPPPPPAAETRPPGGPPPPAPLATPARRLADVNLTDKAANALEKAFEGLSVRNVSAAMFRDWKNVRQLLIDSLHTSSTDKLPTSLRIVTANREASLPWECVTPALNIRLLCRGVRDTEPSRPVPPPDKRSILVVSARRAQEYAGTVAFSIEGADFSGFSIDQIYRSERAADNFETLTSPEPDELREVLTKVRPSVLHLVGQLTEQTNGGIYFDFEGADARVFAATKRAPGPDLGRALSVTRLIRYLDETGQQPVVILDVTAPENITDVLEMLLRRNRFAAELSRSGRARAVFATGLTGAQERAAFIRAMVRNIRDNMSLAYLWHSLRNDEEPQDLLELLSQSSSALFAADPYARIFLDDRETDSDNGHKSWG